MNIDDLVKAYETAHMKLASDTSVLLALGVLQFIKRDYESAGVCFAKAIKENPTDHSIWNKYGAAMSNSMKS